MPRQIQVQPWPLHILRGCCSTRSDSSGPQEHVKREKQIMAECDCPFMVNLVTSFKDTAHLYMLMECVMGGELFTYLQSRPGPLKEDHARFYAASVVLGLEYMQERNLLWRQASNLIVRSCFSAPLLCSEEFVLGIACIQGRTLLRLQNVHPFTHAAIHQSLSLHFSPEWTVTSGGPHGGPRLVLYRIYCPGARVHAGAQPAVEASPSLMPPRHYNHSKL